MAVSTAEIVNFLQANPNMSDADIASAMAQYGVSPAQMAAATGLSVGQVTSRIGAALPTDQAVLFGDTYVQPIYASQGSGENYQQGQLENVITYKASDNKTGGNVNYYDTAGNFQQTTQQQKVPSFTGGLIDVLNDPMVQAALVASGAGGALGGALGLTGSTASAVGTGLLKGGSALAGGASLEDSLKAGLLSGGLVYGGGLLSNAISDATPIDASTMSSEKFNDLLEGNLVKDMQAAGLDKAQISAFLDDIGIGQGVADAASTVTNNITSTTPVTTAADNLVITGNTVPDLTTGGLLSSLLPATTVTTPTVTKGGTVEVAGNKVPEQVDKSVLDLINSQLATNVTTPANLANVQVTGNKGMMSGDTSVTDIISLLAGATPPPTAPTTRTPTVNVVGEKPKEPTIIDKLIIEPKPPVEPTQKPVIEPKPPLDEVVIKGERPTITIEDILGVLTNTVAPTTSTPTVNVVGQRPIEPTIIDKPIIEPKPPVDEVVIKDNKPTITIEDILSVLTNTLPTPPTTPPEVVIKDQKPVPPLLPPIIVEPPQKPIIEPLRPVEPPIIDKPVIEPKVPEIVIKPTIDPVLPTTVLPVLPTKLPVDEVVIKDTKPVVPPVVPTVLPPLEPTIVNKPIIEPKPPVEPVVEDKPIVEPLGLTDAQLLNILKAGLGLFGSVAATTGGTSNRYNAFPTQGVPMYSPEYFNQVQQNYNRLLPAVPRDVSSPLQDWYNSQYGA